MKCKEHDWYLVFAGAVSRGEPHIDWCRNCGTVRKRLPGGKLQYQKTRQQTRHVWVAVQPVDYSIAVVTVGETKESAREALDVYLLADEEVDHLTVTKMEVE